MSIFTLLMTIHVERLSAFRHSLVLVRNTKKDKNIYLPCVGWITLDLGVIVGVIIYE
jgi:hypothetical protein